MKTRTINLLNKYNLNLNLAEELKTKTVFDLLKIKGIGPETILDWVSTLEDEEQQWKSRWAAHLYQDIQRLKYELIKAKREYKHRKFMFIKYGITTDILINKIETTKDLIDSFCIYHPELKEIFKLY